MVAYCSRCLDMNLVVFEKKVLWKLKDEFHLKKMTKFLFEKVVRTSFSNLKKKTILKERQWKNRGMSKQSNSFSFGKTHTNLMETVAKNQKLFQ